MALESQANFKTAIAAAAVQLTTALQDTVDTKTAGVIADPTHPLRQIEKLFSFAPLTGIVTKDDTYIEAFFDDNKIHSKKNPFDVLAKALAALSTATVEDADKSKIIITYDMQMDTGSLPLVADFGLTTDGTPTAISTVVVTGATVTLDCNADFANGDAITIDYTPGRKPIKAAIAGFNSLALAAQVVTNNVT